MHPPDGPADPPTILRVELVERAPSHLRERRVVDSLDLAEGGAGADVDRRDGRHLGGREIGQERVLVENRLA